jgi:hypothetical protein
MDEYSRSGPRTYAAEAKQKELEKRKVLSEGLALNVESDFIVFLRDRLGVKAGDDSYLQAIKLWRSLHP